MSATRPLTSIEHLRDVDLVARVEISEKVGRLLSGNPGASDREAGLELARMLVADASISVREALSRELRHCVFLPDDLVRSLAADLDQVAMPFLMISEAVDDAILEDIVRSGGAGAQEAIASRAALGERVAYALCDVAGENAVETLMENGTATVAERGFRRVIGRFPEEAALLEKMAERSDFPASLAERIIFKVSERYSRYLMEKFQLADDYASYLTSVATRQVVARTLEAAPDREVARYMGDLKAVGGITSDVLLGYLQNGNTRLFMSALAVLLGRPLQDVAKRLSRGDKAALGTMLDRAGFSNSVRGVLVIAFERLFRNS
ncbi:DUF2336 domain-containing protein [Yunchengibacter salinarum]|uniref:DUF2336 domain-containing protein n=1 Tax=Yunchengibacter salinarum TaxID=3133399 RepID=UPI0035B60D4B